MAHIMVDPGKGVHGTMVRVEVVDITIRVCGQLALDPLVSLLLPLHAATV